LKPHYFETTFETFETKIETFETKIETFETKIETFETKIKTFETKIETFETKIETFETTVLCVAMTSTTNVRESKSDSVTTCRPFERRYKGEAFETPYRWWP
jgi:predicted  nucleic acid-binding Zn-ribbon protein